MRTLLSFILTAAFPSAAQNIHGGDYSKHHTPGSSHEYAKMLEDPERDAWQKPHEVVEALDIRPGWTVADIGAGTGYFALRLAHRVGPQGKVLAVDIDSEILAHLRQRAVEQKATNVEEVAAAEDDPRLRPASVDLIFICDVAHHIDKRPAYYKLLAAALKPGGRVAIIDFHKRPLPVGPPEKMKVAREETIREFEQAGFRLAGEKTFLPHQYFLLFEAK